MRREARTLLCIIPRPHMFAHNTLIRCKMVIKGHMWESKKLEKMLECEGGGRRARSVQRKRTTSDKVEIPTVGSTRVPQTWPSTSSSSAWSCAVARWSSSWWSSSSGMTSYSSSSAPVWPGTVKRQIRRRGVSIAFPYNCQRSTAKREGEERRGRGEGRLTGLKHLSLPSLAKQHPQRLSVVRVDPVEPDRIQRLLEVGKRLRSGCRLLSWRVG